MINYNTAKNYTSSESKEYSKSASLQLWEFLKDDIKNNNTLLEAGCGSGTVAHLITQRTGLKVTAIDGSDHYIKRARKLGLNVMKADLQKKFLFKDETFDIVFSGQVVEHLLDPDFFLDECYRVLKKNGKLILTTPNLAAWFNRIIFLFGSQPFFTEVSTIDKTVGLSFTKKLTPNREVVGHIRVFTLNALKDLLKLHNFSPIVHRGYSGGYFPKIIQQIDSLFSYIPSLASNIYIVSVKR